MAQRCVNTLGLAREDRSPMQEEPYSGPKLCECGCGEPAPLAKQTDTAKGYVRGEPMRFVRNHHKRGAKLSEKQRAALLASNVGKPLSPEQRQKMADAKKGERHPLWQGDAANYFAIHKWLRRNFPKTGCCEACGVADDRTEYSFIFGGRGCTRNREDYIELCVPCHRKYDAGCGLASLCNGVESVSA